MADCVMAIGFEKMERGSLKGKVCQQIALLSRLFKTLTRVWSRKPKSFTVMLCQFGGGVDFGSFGWGCARGRSYRYTPKLLSSLERHSL